MEFAVHQPLKIYSGGLGFLAGSHLRSAYELRQNMISIGILWKYGYYDQARNQDQTLQVTWMEKQYSFLEDTGIKFQITIHEHPVWVKVWYLNPETFKTAPLFLLSTDVSENDYVSQTITHRLYDANVATKVAQFILLGVGGAKLMDELGFNPDLYHLNEAHGISAAFYLYQKYGSDIEEVRKRLVFTTHTPEEAGNEKHDIYLCHKMSYFCGLSLEETRKLTGIEDDAFNHSLVALRFAQIGQWSFSTARTCVTRACGANTQAFARSFPSPMHKTGVIGPISSSIRKWKKGMISGGMTEKNISRKEHLKL